MSSPFGTIGRYYDLFYTDKDYGAEVAYLHSLLHKHGISGKKLLEFGCGTGQHACLLSKEGYEVHGIERSTSMLSRVSATQGFTYEHGDITSLQIGRCFDAVLSLFHVVSYQISNSDVSAVFTNAARHLSPGGLFVFDVWYSPAVAMQRPTVRIKRLSAHDLSIIRIAEPDIHTNENRVDVNYTVLAQNIRTGKLETITEVHPMRHFSLPELDLLAGFTGFERLSAEEWLTGAEPSEATWGLCLVLRKT
ncbi:MULTISPECIES: class I SAM-dependent methyltransferase [unclassified Synechococcus]|uniref:class I SAM-dependent DNA methyltransferase n=1 Tax=unclassified Synechococcus TaxID=2626047 RepID=UPI000565EC18|nr:MULTISPECIES: class I SAM-dependent methyltransferase [unclassified Synechococcus]WFN58687.1 class I SAM-dependent methyltransferase [Synechococcus sp. CCFWC 502]